MTRKSERDLSSPATNKDSKKSPGSVSHSILPKGHPTINRRESIAEPYEMNHMMATILDHTDMMVVLLDSQFNFMWVNRAYAETCGKDPSYFPGKNHFDLYPNEENQRIFKTVVDTGEPFFTFAKPFEFPDQPQRGITYWNWSLIPIKDDFGKAFNLVFTLQEVTEQIKANIARGEAEERFRAFMDNSPLIAWAKDAEGRHVYRNRTFENLFGAKLEDWEGKTDFELWPSEIAEEFQKNDQIVLKNEKQLSVKEETINPDGSKSTWLSCKFPYKDASGNSYVGGIALDITEQMRIEKALAESELKYRELVENVNSAILRWKVDGTLFFFNEYAQNFFGYKESEILGKNVTILLPDVDSTGIDLAGLVKAIAANPEQFINNINENIRRDGTRVWMAWTNRPIFDKNGNVIEILAVGTDITALKEAEKKLRMSEERYRTVGESIPYGIWQTDSEGLCTYASNSFLEMTGMTLHEIQEFGWLHLLPEEDREPTREHWTHCVRTGENFEREHRFRGKDGTINYVLAIGRPVRDQHGGITGWVGVNLNINERKKTEEALRVLANFPGQNPNPVMRCTMKGNILYSNAPAQNFLKNLGWHPGVTLPVSLIDMVEGAWENNRPTETEISFRTGQTFSVIFIRPSGEEYVNLYGVDITERKNAKMALQKAHDNLEKKVKERTAELEWRNRELQEFTYVASHDLQEPLRKIKLFGDMLRKELNEALTEQGKDYLLRMNMAADRMKKLVKSLLAYSRTSGKASPFERVNLKPIAEVIVKDLMPEQHGLVPLIEIAELPVIDADPVQMHQLLQNLIANAIHYHKEGLAPVVKISSRILGKTCELIVEDNGIGFDMGYVDKIFLPFERLHPHNKYQGTGMGLAICRKITERHGGKIEAHSIPGEGATFIVSLPLRQTNDAD